MSKKDKKGGGKQPSKWGKGKTDPDSWWKPGCKSPNPKGRPKGSKNQKTLYEQAFGTKVTVNMDGEQKTMTKKELAYHQLAQKAAAGDLKAFQIQKELDEKFDPIETAPPTKEETAADYQTFKAYLELRETYKVFEKEQTEDATNGDDEAEEEEEEEEEESEEGQDDPDDDYGDEDDDDDA